VTGCCCRACGPGGGVLGVAGGSARWWRAIQFSAGSFRGDAGKRICGGRCGGSYAAAGVMKGGCGSLGERLLREMVTDEKGVPQRWMLDPRRERTSETPVTAGGQRRGG
jgi:hypothetical protein